MDNDNYYGDNVDDKDDDDDRDIVLVQQVVTAVDCAKQCAEEPQCHGWSHFAPAKRYNDDLEDDKIWTLMMMMFMIINAMDADKGRSVHLKHNHLWLSLWQVS